MRQASSFATEELTCLPGTNVSGAQAVGKNDLTD